MLVWIWNFDLIFDARKLWVTFILFGVVFYLASIVLPPPSLARSSADVYGRDIVSIEVTCADSKIREAAESFFPSMLGNVLQGPRLRRPFGSFIFGGRFII